MTRQQIVDILRIAKIDPDGHNIILQGDIVHFMTMKPLERRQLIEEIAGISVFEEKKNKSLLELGKVDEKLTEANILLTERDANLRELKKDKDQATKYLELKNKIKDNKATYIHIQIKEKEKKLDNIIEIIEKHKLNYRKFKETMDELTIELNKKKSELTEINEDLEKRGEKDQINIRENITDIKTDVVKSQSRLEMIKNEIKKIEGRKSQLKSSIQENNKKIKSFVDEKKKLDSKISKIEKQQSSISKKIPSKIDMNVKINELARLKSKLGSSGGASNSAIESILDFPGVHGTIAELGKVSSKYGLALEVTAGGKMKSVVTADDTVAEECIRTLKKNRTGVATFLPLNRIKPRLLHPSLNDLTKKEGVHGVALNLIKFNPKYKSAFENIFGNTLIVESIQIARRVGMGRIRMVTLEGDLVEKSGAMIGGSREKTRIGFKQDNVEDEILKLERDLESSNKPSMLNEQKTQLMTQEFELKAAISNFDNKIEYLGNENEKTYQIMADLDKETLEFNQELDGIQGLMKFKSGSLKDSETKEKEFYAKQKSLFSKRNKLTDDIDRQNIRISEKNEKVRIIENKINTIAIEKAGAIASIAGLKKEAEDYKEGKIKKNLNIEVLKKEIKDFEVLMIRLGNVNMKALEIYDQLAKEHAILVEKTDTLRSEKDDIMGMILEIEQDKTKVFMKTYTHLNNRFREIFNSLSTKGEASLVLENPEAPLDAGLDITVRIASRKYLDIRSLSGGEKTMAALAFIFAIQEYNPASFYILDEVDAALDKHNSEKLGKLFAKYSSSAQYIVISHNDSIISEANQIYGVSMQSGVSKITSLRL